MSRESRQGFTLIELIIVVVVIGVLASIVVPKFFMTRERAYQATLRADLRSLSNVEEIYHVANLTYSNSLAAMNMSPSAGVVISINEASVSGWSAVATHPGSPGHQCGIFFGDANSGGGSPATVPGTVTCTFDS